MSKQRLVTMGAVFKWFKPATLDPRVLDLTGRLQTLAVLLKIVMMA